MRGKRAFLPLAGRLFVRGSVHWAQRWQAKGHIAMQPETGYTCRLATPVMPGTAKVLRSRIAPVSADIGTGAHLEEDVLLVVLADDAGWKEVKEGQRHHRAPVMPGVSDGNRTAAQHDISSDQLSSKVGCAFAHAFHLAGFPRYIVKRTRERAEDWCTRPQHKM